MGSTRDPFLDYRALWESSNATETCQLLSTAPSSTTLDRLRREHQPDETVRDRTLPVDWVFFPGLRLRMLAPTSLCCDQEVVAFWPQWGSEVELEPPDVGTLCYVTRLREFAKRPGLSLYEVIGLNRVRQTAQGGITMYATVAEPSAQYLPTGAARRFLDLIEVFTPRVRELGTLAIDVAAASRIWPWGVRLQALRETDADARAVLLLRHLDRMTGDPVSLPVQHEHELRRVGLIRAERISPSWLRQPTRFLATGLSIVDGFAPASGTSAEPDGVGAARHPAEDGGLVVVSVFYGIRVAMYRDRRIDGPHFHALYAGEDASIDLETLEVLAGSIPPQGLRLVRVWAKRQRQALWENWERLQAAQKPMAISPIR